MVRVLRVDRDPGHEPARRLRRVDRWNDTEPGTSSAFEVTNTRPDAGRRPTASRRPAGPLDRHHVVAGAVGRRTAAGQDRRRSARQSPHGLVRNGSRSRTPEHPLSVSACSSPPLSSVRQTCSMPVNSAARRLRVDLERRVERARLGAQLQRVVGRQPGLRIVAVEVHLGRRVEVVVVADRPAGRVEAGLAAVAADRSRTTGWPPCARRRTTTSRCPACRRRSARSGRSGWPTPTGTGSCAARR